MTQEINRRLLTEYLHGNNLIIEDTWFGFTGAGDMREMPTFTTWDDLGALKERLVERKEWHKFFYWAKQRPWTFDHIHEDNGSGFTNWLLNPTRFCELVGEWLGKQEGGWEG